jgi:Domain of unknown function (DUF4145)
MFHNIDEFHQYVCENYPEITDHRIDEDHWDLLCTNCQITRGFQVIKRQVSGSTARRYTMGVHPKDEFVQDVDAPVTYLFRCPVCKAFKQWIAYELELKDDGDKYHTHYFRVTSVPSEGLEDIDELPQTPPSLRTAYRQAIRAMDANAHLAAAGMFRRALQVITRDLLGAKPGNLANELHELVGKTYNGITLTNNFAKVGYIIKEAGNQGAHPDKDPDLLDFTTQDAEDLQNIFMELVRDLFIVPVAVQKAKDDFMARRKIITKP